MVPYITYITFTAVTTWVAVPAANGSGTRVPAQAPHATQSGSFQGIACIEALTLDRNALYVNRGESGRKRDVLAT